MLVQALDHFVVPVNDIVVAEDFYVQVFGGKILKRNGLNVKTQVLGPHTFMDIAGKRIGVYLQKEERGQPVASRGAPTYSFTTTKHGIEEVMDSLERWKIVFEGPQKNSHPFATTTLFFADPAGNHFAVYVPSNDGQSADAT